MKKKIEIDRNIDSWLFARATDAALPQHIAESLRLSGLAISLITGGYASA